MFPIKILREETCASAFHVYSTWIVLTACERHFPRYKLKVPHDLNYGFVQTKKSKKMEQFGWIFEERVILRNNW
jgi:hypothetical protein